MTGVLLKDFTEFAKAKTAQLIEASTDKAVKAGRPNIYLPSSRIDKEQKALEIVQQDNVSSGLICILRVVETCMSYEVRRNRGEKILELQKKESKCTFLYHYGFDDCFGFMGARIQTWFPFAIQIWMNGREWLAQKLDQEGLRYTREDVTSSYQLRPEGIRVKHTAYRNTVKVYDKTGSILRTESTVNNHRAFRVFRPSERNPQGPSKTLPMSKGIVDLYARSQVSDKINNRYLEALATLDTNERIESVVAPILQRRQTKGKSIRAWRPWSPKDKQLLSAVASCGLAGDFRNRDIANHLYPSRPTKDVSGQVSYLLRILREHKIIRRLPNTRRYRLTPKGAKIIATILLSQSVTTQQLNKAAA